LPRAPATSAWQKIFNERFRAIAHGFNEMTEDQWQPSPDDGLRLVFIACHPVLSRD
jgi:predicted RNA polymerase sigma factor